MIFAKQALKKAATVTQMGVKARIASPQGGVPTFFDNFLRNLLNRLMATEKTHHWDVARHTQAGSPEAQLTSELQWFERYTNRVNQGRLVSYESRRKAASANRFSDIGDLELVMSQGTKACLTWKGKPLFKTAFDFALFPMLLWDLKPRTIFEIGSGTGSSALWISETARTFGLETQTYSVDIHPISDTHADVHFLQADCTSPETLFPADLLQSAPHPWLVIEDAHVNVHAVLSHMHSFLQKGDYLFVEDSLIKAADVDKFMLAHASHYRVDTHYTDFFGRNATCAPDSIFVRV